MIAQIPETIDSAARGLDGRSESLVVVLAGMAFCVFVMWRDSRKQTKADERQERIDEAKAKQAEADSETLSRIAAAVEQQAETAGVVSDAIELLQRRQTTDRRAILLIHEAVLSAHRGDDQAAEQAHRDVRALLVGADTE
ncbi:MAG: hypothetical protein AAFP90_24245 [Planctomycetota bacterium]